MASTLRALLEKGSEAKLLREILSFVAQRLMELETEALWGTAHGERSPDRTNQRNGFRDRSWETHSKVTQGQLFSGFLEPRPRC